LFAGHRTSFTAHVLQSNASTTCARVAGTDVCGCHRGRKLIFTTVETFLSPWKLIFNTLEIDFFITVENDFYHRGNSFLLPLKIDLHRFGTFIFHFSYVGTRIWKIARVPNWFVRF